MITEHSQAGIAIAKQLSNVYLQNPNVKAMILGGSVSRGIADGYSDIELGVFWDRVPTDEERQALINEAGGSLWMFNSYTSAATLIANEHWGLEQINIEGTIITGTSMIDVKHMTLASMSTCLHDVAERLDTSLDKQVILAALVDAISLIGDRTIEQWRQQARYPKSLAVKTIQENLWFGPWYSPTAYVQRDDVLVMQQHIVWAVQAMLRILCALNKTYYPSPEHKWMDFVIERFQYAPTALTKRLKKVFGSSLEDSWHLLKQLIDETILLVEKHLPEVNTVKLFADHPEIDINWAKARWKIKPPYTLMQQLSERKFAN